MADHDGAPDAGMRNYTRWDRDIRFSRAEIEQLIDQRAREIVDDRLSMIGLTMGDEVSKTAAMIESWKTMSKGLRAFVMSVLSSIALSLVGFIWYLVTGHKQ